MKFVFSRSKLRKQPFIAEIFIIQGRPRPLFRRQWMPPVLDARGRRTVRPPLCTPLTGSNKNRDSSEVESLI